MTSSKAVIAKVIADLGLNETEIPITDIRQWIGEALICLLYTSIPQKEYPLVITYLSSLLIYIYLTLITGLKKIKT